MPQMTDATRGDLALSVLRWVLLATGCTFVGVLAHVVWRAMGN